MKFVAFFVFSLLLLGCKNEPKQVSAPVTSDNAATTPSPVADPAAAVVVDSSKFTTISWEAAEKDFGKIKEGEKLEAKFVFKNTGAYPLIIQSARASCGCTVAEYTKEPVAPGASGEVKGVFDSQGKPGHQKKSIYVYANTKGGQSHELNFGVEVLKKQ